MKKDFTLSNFMKKSSMLTTQRNIINKMYSPGVINSFRIKNFSTASKQIRISNNLNYSRESSNLLFKNTPLFNFHTKTKISYDNPNPTQIYTSSQICKNHITAFYKNFYNKNNNTSVIKLHKHSFCDSSSFKDREDYIYIISIRSKMLKSIRREPNPKITQYWEINKYNGLSFKDVQDAEQVYSKLDKDQKIASTLRLCSILLKKKYYSKHLIDYFIDNCSEIAEDSLFNLNGFICYINGLELKPNQINFNPNFFKIVEDNFFKEGVLMDLLDMKVYMRFFYRFKNCFSQKLFNYAERCLIYLLENQNSYTIYNLYEVMDIMKYCFISGSDRCFQKIVDYFTKMIMLKSANFTEVVEYLKIMATLTGRVLKSENILNYEVKYDILVRGFDKIKLKIYEYMSKEKVEIMFIRNLLQLLIQNHSISYFKGINFKDLIVSYILKNENDIDPENLRVLLRMMCVSRNFIFKYNNELDQLILSNLSVLDNLNNSSMIVLYSYLRNSNNPNPAIRDFTELVLIKNIMMKGKEAGNSYPMNFLKQKFFYNEIMRKNMSAFLAFCLIDGNEKLIKHIEEGNLDKVDISKDNPLPVEEEEVNA